MSIAIMPRFTRANLMYAKFYPYESIYIAVA